VAAKNYSDSDDDDGEADIDRIQRSLSLSHTTLKKKWGKLTHQFGYTAIPNIFFFVNKYTVGGANKLTPTEYMILMMLLSFWWRRYRMPFPSTRELALRANVSQRQVFRAIKSLEKKGFIERMRSEFGFEFVRRSKGYNLLPTAAKMNSIAAQAEIRKDEKKARDDLTRDWIDRKRGY
jgi:DNA-binding MarR family transcriptional regulator